jgi:hypothetical protein
VTYSYNVLTWRPSTFYFSGFSLNNKNGGWILLQEALLRPESQVNMNCILIGIFIVSLWSSQSFRSIINPHMRQWQGAPYKRHKWQNTQNSKVSASFTLVKNTKSNRTRHECHSAGLLILTCKITKNFLTIDNFWFFCTENLSETRIGPRKVQVGA